jgi:biotin carboxylase
LEEWPGQIWGVGGSGSGMKKIMFLGAGLEQSIAIKRAQELGYLTVAMDGNAEAPGLRIADEAVVGDIRSVSQVESYGREFEVSGLFAHGVEVPVVVAEAARRLGLPGLDPRVAQVSTNKGLRNDALSGAGIRVPKSIHLSSADSAEAVLETLRFPVVTKPCDNSGARGVCKVTKPASLKPAIDFSRTYSRSSCVTVEEFVPGPQLSTEAFVCGEDVRIFGIADRNYSSGDEFFPYFVEDGVDIPSSLSDQKILEVRKVVTDAIHALGIDFGAAKGDIIVSEQGPVVLEMACRTSGGWFLAGSVPMSTGVNAFDVLIPQAAGDPFDVERLTQTKSSFVAQRYWIPRETGRLGEVGGLSDAAQSDGVVMFESFFPMKGSKIRKSTNHSERYAQVIAEGQSREHASELAKRAIARLRVEIE